jgi:hypothetical protein
MDPRSVPPNMMFGFKPTGDRQETSEEKLDRLEKEVATLKKEIGDLRASQEAGWGSDGR